MALLWQITIITILFANTKVSNQKINQEIWYHGGYNCHVCITDITISDNNQFWYTNNNIVFDPITQDLKVSRSKYVSSLDSF